MTARRGSSLRRGSSGHSSRQLYQNDSHDEDETEDAASSPVDKSNTQKRRRVQHEPYMRIMDTEEHSQVYANLFQSKKHSDIIIQCSDDEKNIETHSCILSANSPVFRAMLDNLATTTNPIKIEDVSRNTMKALLEYFYTGCIKVVYDFEDMKNILMAADKYEVGKLKQTIFKQLVANLDVENLGDIAVLSEKYKAPDPIKFRLQEFITQKMPELRRDFFFRIANLKHSLTFFTIMFGTFDEN